MPTMTKTKDAISLLKMDHKEVKRLFDAFEDTDQANEQKKIADQAIKELKIHATIEEEIFYPAVNAALGKDHDIVTESKEEHRVAKTLIEALEQMSPKDEEFEAKFIVLAENVRHHIKEEENEMFKKIKSKDLDLEQLGEQMTARKEELMQNEQSLQEAVESSEVKPYQELGSSK